MFLSVYWNCPTVPSNNATPAIISLNDTSAIVLMGVDAGCAAITLESVEAWIYTLKYPICILLVLAGLYIGVYGNTMWKIIFFILLLVVVENYHLTNMLV